MGDGEAKDRYTELFAGKADKGGEDQREIQH